MSAQFITRVLFFVWVCLFVGAFVITAITPSRDFGLSAGFDRIEVFFKWQFFAGLAGIFLWGFGRSYATGTVWRWLSRAPALVAALVFFMVIFLIMGANLGKPAPQNEPPSDRPTTAVPAKPVKPQK